MLRTLCCCPLRWRHPTSRFTWNPSTLPSACVIRTLIKTLTHTLYHSLKSADLAVQVTPVKPVVVNGVAPATATVYR